MGEHNHTCESLLDSLSDYIDGSLKETLCHEIEQHMAGCENCRIVIDTLKKTIYLYHESANRDEQVPSMVRERLFKRLNLDQYLHTEN